ncbi:sulfurtransferase [Kitasatospora cheerisanensis]|uniref:3-mercaptopyruvate sulfurtransferase n=1 Tax=Kitasatospora cheerisanensis KCTC 2395 TaxID=1348663 RepID=A0A066Z7D7_9ACTN|nr:3-mercaptopyruvate sulfurtransferase [Kitasatospora cheerisanensis KCTC 2395]
MTALPPPLVDPSWLAERLADPDLVVLDASVGAHRHAAHRIPGARPFDLDGALSDQASDLPHTMPSAADFQRELRALGVNDRSTVVVYDGAGIYSAPRAWWMLRAMGFDRAAVLDGGLPAWQAAGHPVTTEQLPCSPGDFTARPRPGLLVDRSAVAAALADPDTAVLDARSHERFTGAAPEPRPHLRRGHLPAPPASPSPSSSPPTAATSPPRPPRPPRRRHRLPPPPRHHLRLRRHRLHPRLRRPPHHPPHPHRLRRLLVRLGPPRRRPPVRHGHLTACQRPRAGHARGRRPHSPADPCWGGFPAGGIEANSGEVPLRSVAGPNQSGSASSAGPATYSGPATYTGLAV